MYGRCFWRKETMVKILLGGGLAVSLLMQPSYLGGLLLLVFMVHLWLQKNSPCLTEKLSCSDQERLTPAGLSSDLCVAEKFCGTSVDLTDQDSHDAVSAMDEVAMLAKERGNYGRAGVSGLG